MWKLPFYIGNFVACFVPGTMRRARVRGWINITLYRPQISAFIKRVYGERARNVRFIRQRTLNRVVCVVNDKYYVKIFRNVSIARLRDFMFLVNYTADRMHTVRIPRVIVNDNAQMYVCERMPGHDISHFAHADVLRNEEKILAAVNNIIDELQSIDVMQIPDWQRFVCGMQFHHFDSPVYGRGPVLGHFDMNETNFLFDDDMNICSVVDWDALSIANNPETDRRIFMNFWNLYKKYGK